MNALLLLAAGTAWAASSFECPHPRYEDGMAAATREVEALTPEEAGRALARLKERSGAEGADGRLGFGALLAVRAQGVELSGGVYCDDPPNAADPIGDRWIGVEAKDGRRYRLDLVTPGGKVDPSAVQELGAFAAEDGAAQFASYQIEGGGAFLGLWQAFKKRLFSLAGRPYVFGGTDCAWLPHAALNSTPGMCSRGRSYFDQDSACFTRCDAGPYLPGDLILMGRSEPDHWVILSEVADQSRANSPRNKIIDQSSDCGGFCGEAAVRPNLAERRVYACARPKALARAYAADMAAPRRQFPLIEASRAGEVLTASAAAADSLSR